MIMDKNLPQYHWLRPAMKATFEHLQKQDKIVGVELGYYGGDNAGALLEFCEKLILHVSDIREYDGGKKTALKFKDRLITHIGPYSWDLATEFQDASVDFVYIDASHQGEDVTKDMNAWWSKIKSGGIMGGHDYYYAFKPLMDAVDVFAEHNKLMLNVHRAFNPVQALEPNCSPCWSDWWIYKP